MDTGNILLGLRVNTAMDLHPIQGGGWGGGVAIPLVASWIQFLDCFYHALVIALILIESSTFSNPKLLD